MLAEEVLGSLTWLLLLATLVIMMVQAFRMKRNMFRKDFIFLMLIFIMGWLGTDLVAAFSKGLEQFSYTAYLLILIVFVAALTRRWKWAAKQGAETIAPNEPSTG